MTAKELIDIIKKEQIQLTQRNRWVQWSEAEGEWYIYEAADNRVKIIDTTAGEASGLPVALYVLKHGKREGES